MHGSRLPAVGSVQQTQRSAGLCDCLKQPRRVRPVPLKNAEYEMVETRPRRRIRVIHLLPLKKPKTKTTNKDSSANIPQKTVARLHFCDPTEAANGHRCSIASWDDLNKNGTLIVRADVASTETENYISKSSDEFKEYSEFDDYEKNYQYGEQEDAEDDIASEYAFPVNNFLPVYGFESPFHPKNYFNSDEDTAIRLKGLKVFADHLVHKILDDVFLEFGSLWGILFSVHETEECEQLAVKKATSELESDYIVCTVSNDDSKSDRLSSYKCRLTDDPDNEKISGKFSTWCAPSLNEWEHRHNNLALQMNSDSDDFTYKRNPIESLMVNGYGHIFENDFPSTSTAYLPKSSFRISKRGHKSSYGSRNVSNASVIQHWTTGDDGEGPIDPFAKFTYHPTGDDTCSQPDSSFQSSTWGSSTASSLRYVRRFTSKKYKTKPLMLFIHGIGDSADLWRNQFIFFREKGYETLSMDLIGHGLSCAPNESKAYTFNAILTDVLVIFDRYSKERNVIIGHSYGACFAAALSRHRPKQVTHLILVSSGGPFPLCPQPSKICLPNCITQCLQSLSSCGTRRKTFYVPSRKQTRLIRNLDIPSYVLKYMTKGQIWLEGDASFHKQITIPTLLIYGLRDPFVTLVEECEMEKTIPRAFLELIPEASHMVMLDAPDQVNDMIYKFLRRWDR